MASKEKKFLFSEFPPVSKSAWEEKIKEDLKGAEYEKKLIWKSFEGIDIRPYYRSEDVKEIGWDGHILHDFPYVKSVKQAANNWYIRQQIITEDADNANKTVHDLIDKGVTSTDFFLTRKFIPNSHALSVLLHNIPFSSVEVNLSGYKVAESVYFLQKYLQASGLSNEIKGTVDFDPIGRLCTKGHFYADSEQLSVDKILGLLEISETMPHMRVISVSARHFANAGASVIQELAFGLALGAEYLIMLTDRGINVNEAAARIAFNMATSSNYFFEIAKYRAARLLWDKILEAFDNSCKEPMYIHAETAKWNISIYDPYVNILRTTTESMSAIVGGVNALTVLPFDLPFRKPEGLSTRIARNQQIILKEEAYFDKVIDPAAGSYYIENLTKSIAKAAWDVFIEVQQKGGFVECMKQGFIQAVVGESAQKHINAMATRREVMVGVNQYPCLNEVYNKKPVDYSMDCCNNSRANVQSVENNCCLPDECLNCDCNQEQCICSCCNETLRLVQPLKLLRAANEFEKIRLQTDFSSKRPKVFLLTIGNPAMRRARAQFSASFFACAGYEIIDNMGFTTIEEGTEKALNEHADIVVLCSSDDEYAELAPEAFKRLDGKAVFVVAGMPPCAEELKMKGIENFIHIRSNILETLKFYQQKLKIAP
jgi:methylmalonyl-CoA mutase